MSTNLRSGAPLLRNEFHMLPVLGEWLDILIFLCYLSIPVQLVLLLLKPPVVMDHRKLTSTFSNVELFRTRLLLLYFAMFIIFCGLGHGINAMCSATAEESMWCFLVVPGKMVIALTSGATSVMLLLWMPSLTSWLRAIEIHRKGFTEVVVNELSLSNELSDVTFGSLMHVQELANQVEQLQAELEALRAERCRVNDIDCSAGWSFAALAKLWSSKKKRGNAVGYQRVLPQSIGASGEHRKLAAANPSAAHLASSKPHEEDFHCLADILSITFAGPSWTTCEQSPSFTEICGSCGSLQEFSGMLLEGRFLMGQAHAAVGALHRARIWRRSLVFEVTLVPPQDSSREYRADCAVKATRRCDGGKDMEVLHVWLWGLGAQLPRDQRSKPKSAASSQECASTTMSEERSSSRMRAPAGGDTKRKQRERLAFNSVQRKMPDLEDMVVQCGRTWRAAEGRQTRSANGEAGFRQAVSRLDIARMCLSLPPVLPRLHFERKQGITEVYDVKDMARNVVLDLLAGQRLESWLWELHDEPERMPMRGVALVAQQATHVYAMSAGGCSPQRICDVGEVVVAAGPPQEASGVVLVPIEGEGVVQVGHFAIDPSAVQAASAPQVEAATVPQPLPKSAAAEPAATDAAAASDSSTDPEDDQLHFRLGLMS